MTRILPFAIWLIFIISCISIPVCGQQPAAPQNITELKKILNSEMERQHIVGMMLTIVNKDSVLCSAGLGFSDLSKKQPVAKEQLFRAASITKMFVAAAVLKLVEQGKLSLNTRLRDIAPDIRFTNEWEAKSPITIEKLLEHTTGFSDKSPFEEYNFSSRSYTSSESTGLFKKFMTSKWQPGERHSYSSVNYAILDNVIERVSGKVAKTYVKEQIFSKFGMLHANLDLTSDGTNSYSKGYVWKGDHFQIVPHQPAFSSSYSSLNISADDAAQALRMYLNDWNLPARSFLTKQILEDSETPHTYLSAKAGLVNTYAHGNESTEQNGVTLRGHRGAIGGFLSAFFYNRQLGLGYAFATNTHNEDFYRFADKLISQYLLRNVPKPAVIPVYPINRQHVKPYLGYYRYANPSQLYSGFFESLTNTIQVSQMNNSLNVRIIGRGQMEWQATDVAGRIYKDVHASLPHISLLKDYDGNLAISDGTMYFEKISAWQALSPILLFICSSLLLISTLVFGFITTILFITKKQIRSQWILRLSPAFATFCILISLSAITQLFDHMKEALPMNGLHHFWIFGNYGFAIFTLVTIAVLLRKWKTVKSPVLKIYVCLTSAAGVYLTALLFENHWFLN